MSKFIIVGHGLAGAVLAHRLLNLGKKIQVIDAGLPHSASEVSVGLINPLIGPKLNPPVKILECLRENNLFFPDCENAWNRSFYFPLPLHRIFISEKQKERWFALKIDPQNSRFLDEYLSVKECNKMGIDAPFGAGITKQAYQLDVSSFLSASQALLQKNGLWNPFPYNRHKHSPNDKVIFCEGFRVKDNPLFKDLPFAPARGETFQIEDTIRTPLSNGSWYLPDNTGRAIMGSTWDHDNLLCGSTEQGKKEIIKKCAFVQVESCQIKGGQSGVRSGTRDRNPIMGVHEENKNCFLFNGFGSRGTSTIPYYSKWMVDFLIKNIPLPTEVNLTRF